MHRYQVGKPFISDQPNRTYREGFVFDYKKDSVSVVAFFNQPARDEIRVFKNGVPQFALYEGEACAVLCVRFGTQPWSDSSWEAWRSVAELPEPDANAIMVMLCDTNGGIIKNIRVIGLDTEFASNLYRVIARLKKESAPPEIASGELNQVMQLQTSEIVERAQYRAK